MRIYIAGPFSLRLLVGYMAAELESEGHTITYKWFDEELAVEASVDNVGQPRVKLVAEHERQGVVTADAVLVLVPATGGTGVWWECGFAAASRVPIFAMSARGDGPPPYRSIFDALYEKRIANLSEFKQELAKLADRTTR